MTNSIWSLLQQLEPLASLSIAHLTPATRDKLASGTLSIPVYPNEYGGFVHVGVSGDGIPTEADLAHVFDVARKASLIWLKFDADAAIIDGLPLFPDAQG